MHIPIRTPLETDLNRIIEEKHNFETNLILATVKKKQITVLGPYNNKNQSNKE